MPRVVGACHERALDLLEGTQGVVETLAEHGGELAQGVGDIAVAIWPPAVEQPSEKHGVVPVGLLVPPYWLHYTGPHRCRHGESEILAGLDEVLGSERFDGATVAGDELGQVVPGTGVVDGGVQGAHIEELLWHFDPMCSYRVLITSTMMTYILYMIISKKSITTIEHIRGRGLYYSYMFELLHRYAGLPQQMALYVDRRPASYAATVVFLHGIGNSGAAWEKVLPRLPRNVRAVTFDLIGFGGSPKPAWAKYDVEMQARSLHRTLRRHGVRGPIILVGHSLGSLVSIEYAKAHPASVRELILCSPPFYEYSDMDSPILKRKVDDFFKQAYGTVTNMDRARLSKFVTFANKTRLLDPDMVKNEEMLAAYVQTIESSIIQQSSLQDACSLKVPIRVVLGIFDPLVLARHVNRLKKDNSGVSVTRIAAGHDIKGAFVKEVADQVKEVVGTV